MRPDRFGWLGLALVLGLAGFAYRSLFLGFAETSLAERWLFDAELSALPVAAAVACWALARRFRRLTPRSGTERVGAATWALLLFCVMLFVAGSVAKAPGPLLLSLAAGVWAACGAVAGRAGLREAAVPILILTLGVSVPDVLSAEWVWWLQRKSAESVAWVLPRLGIPVSHAGVVLEVRSESFLVIEECSGARGVQILTFVALAIRELFRDSSARVWLVVLAAPLLGFVLNVARIAIVVSSANPAALVEDHAPQGIAVLLVGTLVLYGWAALLDRKRGAEGQVDTQARVLSWTSWNPAALVLGILGVASLWLPPAGAVSDAKTFEMPLRIRGWHGEPVFGDPLFMGALPRDRVTFLRYTRKSGEVVDCLVVLDTAGNAAVKQLLSSKGKYPGPDWTLSSEEAVRVWTLAVDAEQAVLVKGAGQGRVLSYSWRLPQEALWRVALREFMDPRTSRQRVGVRVATALSGEGELVKDRAKQVLDHFVRDLRVPLSSL